MSLHIYPGFYTANATINIMVGVSNSWWASLEQWSVGLFLVGSVLELVFAAINGVAFLTDAFTYRPWISLTVLVARLALLLGIAGLSVQIVNRNPRLGKWARVVVSLAVGFTIGLLVLAALDDFGLFRTPIIAVFGLGTVVLTVLTFALFGVAILRTDSFSPLIGGLLVAASVMLVALFVGLEILALPTRLAGAIGEGIFFVLFLAIWNALRAESVATDPSQETLGPTMK